jgi:hypothetical protein
MANEKKNYTHARVNKEFWLTAHAYSFFFIRTWEVANRK